MFRAGRHRGALRRPCERLVLADPEGRGPGAVEATSDVGRVGTGHLPVGADDAVLPVVEVQLAGHADDALRLRRVLHVRQADGDLVAAGGPDLDAAHAELVAARAHDVDRVGERRPVDRQAGGGARLEDQLGPALQIEPEMGLLRLDDSRDADGDQQRHEHQRRDEREDEGVAGSVAHRALSGTV
jgi:hypothetical protein